MQKFYVHIPGIDLIEYARSVRDVVQTMVSKFPRLSSVPYPPDSHDSHVYKVFFDNHIVFPNGSYNLNNPYSSYGEHHIRLQIKDDYLYDFTVILLSKNFISADFIVKILNNFRFEALNFEDVHIFVDDEFINDLSRFEYFYLNTDRHDSHHSIKIHVTHCEHTYTWI